MSSEEDLLAHFRYLAENDDRDYRSLYSARMNSTPHNYEEYLHEVSYFTSLLISRDDLRQKIPYETWSWFTYEERYPALLNYVMHQEIDYLIKLFDFLVTRETILQHISLDQWKSLITLYRKTTAVWIIGVHVRTQYYHETLDLEQLKPSIRECLRKLDGVLYDEEYNASYKVTLLENLSAYEVIHWGICVLRARQDMKVPIRNAGELRHAIIDIESKVVHGISSSTFLGLMILACFHENLLNVHYSHAHAPGYIESSIHNIINPIVSEFTINLCRECSIERGKRETMRVIGPLNKDNEDSFWNDTCLITSSNHSYRPLNRWTETLQTLLFHMDKEYYFHPRHSSNPDDHYRFLCSLLPLSFKGDDIEEKSKILVNIVNRVSEKKIVTRDCINKRGMFAEVHQELLYSPNLPVWFGNEYTRSKEHFDATRLHHPLIDETAKSPTAGT